jgi:hypothetical protein
VTESRIVTVPIVVEPVPIENHLVAVLVEIRDIEVTVAVPLVYAKCLPYHHPLNTLKVESNSASHSAE